jgi:hypothetical protein
MFLSVLASLRCHREQVPGKDHWAQKAWEAELQAEALKWAATRTKSKRSSMKPETAIARMPLELKQALLAKHNPIAVAVFDEWNAIVKLCESRLDKLADDASILEVDRVEGPPQWFLLGSSHDGSYNSQGYGASHCAQGSAENLADLARHWKVPVTVARKQPLRAKNWNGASYEYAGEWLVYVLVASELDVEILRRRSSPTLREQVRLCWARGINPRVLNPFLKPGYEEQEGLDYFGRDLRAVEQET